MPDSKNHNGMSTCHAWVLLPNWLLDRPSFSASTTERGHMVTHFRRPLQPRTRRSDGSTGNGIPSFNLRPAEWSTARWWVPATVLPPPQPFLFTTTLCTHQGLLLLKRPLWHIQEAKLDMAEEIWAIRPFTRSRPVSWTRMLDDSHPSTILSFAGVNCTPRLCKQSKASI